MGLFTGFKAAKAYQLHGKGQTQEARKLYEECLAEGGMQPRYLLAYCVLLIRSGEYAKAKELLVKHQKDPGMTPDQKVNLFMNYAACVFKLGDIDKGIAILERQHQKQPSGLVYETLGYLYVEKYALENKPDFDTLEAETTESTGPAELTDEDAAPVPAPAELTPRQQWEAGREKAVAYLNEAIEYDDEDAICLDNMGQLYYRVLGDKAAAREWFDKALQIKENQIDTLYFLSRYDLDAGDAASAKARLEKALEGRFSPLNYADRATIEAELKKL